MKALVLKEVNRFEYTDVPEPEYGADDVLIDVKAVSICGSDVHGYDGGSGRRRPPVIMGHEAAGVICATGANVNIFINMTQRYSLSIAYFLKNKKHINLRYCLVTKISELYLS